jgi:phosphatidylserine decarboxylase
MNHHSPIAAEGLPWITVPAVFTIIALALGWRISAIILCLLTLFVVWFFRNPERKIPENSKFIISPADGKVLRIEDVADQELFKGPLKKISIFMNVFNGRQGHRRRNTYWGVAMIGRLIVNMFRTELTYIAGGKNRRRPDKGTR